MSRRSALKDKCLTNSDIAELLASEAETATQPLQKALRRASRKAFLWPEEAAQLIHQERSLEELPGVGPYLSKLIRRWIEHPPLVPLTPEIRKDFLTILQARSVLSKSSAWLSGLKGDLQMHTQWSDGSGTIAEMADMAQQRNYEYIAITDHSKGLKIAGGIDEKALRKQAVEIAKANRSIPRSGKTVTVLSSIELNLNPRGEGDMDPKALAKLDLVLGSFHSVLRVKHDQTARYLAALRNPDIQILGHPRGRIYNYRLGLKADWPRVFAEAAKRDKAVEIDCYPDRQDLNVTLLKLARAAGTRVSLGTDAHHPWQLEFIELGLAAALKAKIPAKRIVNFMPLADLKTWVAKVRRKARQR